MIVSIIHCHCNNRLLYNDYFTIYCKQSYDISLYVVLLYSLRMNIDDSGNAFS